MKLSAPQLAAESRTALGDVLHQLVDTAAATFGEGLVGCYLVGSFALGCGDEHSDVDFLVVTRDEVTAAERAGLAKFHARMPDSPIGWAQHLEGSYPSIAEIRRPTESAWLSVDNGSRVLERSRHDNTAHVRWILRRHGIALRGPAPAALVDPVPRSVLRREAADYLQRWRAEVSADASWLANAWEQQHAVMSICRILCTRETGRVVCKLDAATWALSALDERWHPLIGRAIADRPDPWDRVRRQAPPDLVEMTREFVLADRPLASEAP